METPRLKTAVYIMFYSVNLFDSTTPVIKDKKAARAAAEAHRQEWIMRIMWQYHNIMRPTFGAPILPREGSPAYEKAMRYLELANLVKASKVA